MLSLLDLGCTDDREAASAIARIAEFAAMTHKRRADFAWEREFRMVAAADPGASPKWAGAAPGKRYASLPLRPRGMLPTLTDVLVTTDDGVEHARAFLAAKGYADVEIRRADPGAATGPTKTETA